MNEEENWVKEKSNDNKKTLLDKATATTALYWGSLWPQPQKLPQAFHDKYLNSLNFPHTALKLPITQISNYITKAKISLKYEKDK